MKFFYFVILLSMVTLGTYAQTPCTLKLDEITLDTSTSDCNHLFFKYTYSGGSPVNYHWTYGDGNSCFCFKPKNVYNKNGSFKVCGKITDINGCADSICIFVAVNCNNPCDLSEIGIFSFDTLSYSCNEMEFNTITSSNTKKVKWNFGDGDSSESKFIVHKFKKNGVYKVKLHIHDSISCADSAELTVHIDCPPSCSFVITKIDTSTGNECNTKIFNLNSNEHPKSVLWDYGDGQKETGGINAYRTYSDTGLFQVCAIGIDSNNCRDTLCHWVKVSCSEKNVSVYFPHKNIFRLYPNPAGKLLQLESSADAVYTIFDPAFKMVLSGFLVSGNNIIDLEHIRYGTYIIKIENSDIIFYFKVLKE